MTDSNGIMALGRLFFPHMSMCQDHAAYCPAAIANMDKATNATGHSPHRDRSDER